MLIYGLSESLLIIAPFVINFTIDSKTHMHDKVFNVLCQTFHLTEEKEEEKEEKEEEINCFELFTSSKEYLTQ